jgi:hypothetical protein
MSASTKTPRNTQPRLTNIANSPTSKPQQPTVNRTNDDGKRGRR